MKVRESLEFERIAKYTEIIVLMIICEPIAPGLSLRADFKPWFVYKKTFYLLKTNCSFRIFRVILNTYSKDFILYIMGNKFCPKVIQLFAMERKLCCFRVN